MDAKPVLGIDFGTTNTYIAKCPGDRPQPIGVDFGDGRDGVSTAVLYRTERATIVGDRALEEFGEATQAERRGYRIHAQFKPDIARSADARRCARDFLAGLLRDAAACHIDLAPAERDVIVGVPAEIDDAYRRALIEVAAEAGFGSIAMVDEPKGAIYYHVHRKDITPSEALRGALVVDFGGGTCDFAWVVQGEVRHSWGEVHLGGRLFDDLFYQWYIDENPRAERRLRADQAEFIVLWFHCRRLKEKFSQAMALDRATVMRRKCADLGGQVELTWDRFIERARNYRLSGLLANYLREANPAALECLDTERPTDLLAWFSRSLCDGLDRAGLDGARIACVVLTGGSSGWPFVADIVAAELRARQGEPRLVRSDRPYCAISEGLSILPALQRRFARVRAELRDELNGFVAEQVYPVIEERLKTAGEHIGETVAGDLFDRELAPVLVDFRERGGAVADLKERIADKASAFEPRIRTVVEGELARVLTGIPVTVAERMAAWLDRHDLVIESDVIEDRWGLAIDGDVELQRVDIYREIEAVVGAVSVGVVTTLVASISGGAGTAIIMSGPIGTVIGGIIGLVAGGIAAYYGLEEAKRRAERWEGTPLWLIRRLLSDRRIASLRNSFKQQIVDKVLGQTAEAQGRLERHVRERIEAEIENLSAVTQS